MILCYNRENEDQLDLKIEQKCFGKYLQDGSSKIWDWKDKYSKKYAL